MDVAALADLLHETADHHDAFEKAATPHDWWDWYAAYMDAREGGQAPDQASTTARRYMEEVRHVVLRDTVAAAEPDETTQDTAGALSHWREMKRILVATDGSLTAVDAVGFAIDFAAARDAELIFVHVVPTIDLASSPEIDGPGVAIPHVPTDLDRAPLQEASAVAADHDVASTSVLRGGSTADEIVDCAASNDVDLIVIGSRGRGAISRALLGSVAVGVLHAARQPVVVVRCAVGPHPLTGDV